MNRNFADRIKVAAARIGGQAALAAALGTSPQAVGNWTGAKGTIPGGDALAAIAAATGCSPGWLLTGEGEPFPAASTETAKGRAAVDEALAGLKMAVDGVSRAIAGLLPLLSADQAAELVEQAARAAVVHGVNRPTPPPA